MTDFHSSFSGALGSKFAVNAEIIKIPPHIKRVASPRCELFEYW